MTAEQERARPGQPVNKRVGDRAEQAEAENICIGSLLKRNSSRIYLRVAHVRPRATASSMAKD